MSAATALDAHTISTLEPALFRYALKKTGRDDVARELVQDTWLAAITSIDRFEGRASLKTWLTSILRRKIVDLHRRRRPQVDIEESREVFTAPPERERLDDRAAAALVIEALAELPPREQEAVRLVDVGGKSREEAAAEMAVRREALRVLLHRGRKRLRKALEDAGYADAAE